MTPKHHSATAIAVVLLLLTATVPAVAAQPENTTTSTAPDEDNGTALIGDSAVTIEDYWLEDGTMHVQLHAEQVRRVQLSAPPGTDAEVAGGYVNDVLIQADQTKTATIRSPDGVVWLATKQSNDNGRFTRVSTSSGSILPGGPYTQRDLVIVGAAVGVGVAFAVLRKVYDSLYGDPPEVERVA